MVVVVLKNAVAPAQPVAARAVTKPARKLPAKNIPRPEQAPKENRKPTEGAAKDPEGNRKPSKGAAAVQKNGRKKLVCTLSTVLSARSKVQHLCSALASNTSAALASLLIGPALCINLLLCSRRCQAACGLTEKPKPLIEDIDKFDGDNQLALVDYVEDIYTFYKTAQVTVGSSFASLSQASLF